MHTWRLGVSMVALMVVAALSCTVDEEQDDDDDGSSSSSSSSGTGGGEPVQCNVEYCEDLIYYCTWLKENCSEKPDATVQGCVDQLIINLGYCELPANYASCIADCIRDDPSQSCADFDDCHDDHECMWFGDC